VYAVATAVKVDGNVGTVAVAKAAASTTVTVGSTGVIATVETAADGVSISGEGTVTTAIVTGNDTEVSTDNTAVKKAADATGVVVSGEGSTTTILPTEDESDSNTTTSSSGSNTNKNTNANTSTNTNTGTNSGSGSGPNTTTTTTTYTVTFDSNGGTAIDAVTVNENKTVAAPDDPTRAEDTFGGWYTADGEPYDFETPVTADITLTAKWTVLHAHDWNGNACTVCGETKDEAMKFLLSVASDSAVTATVYDDYSMVVQLPDAGSTVSTSGVSIEVAMQNVDSLDVSGKKSGMMNFAFTELGDRDVELDSYLKNCYDFGSATVILTVGETKCTYNFKGESDNTIVAAPEDIAAARAAWQTLAGAVETGTGGGTDIVIANGSTLQIGTEKLSFESDYTDDLSLAALNETGDLNGSIREAVELGKGVAMGAKVKAVLESGTSLVMDNSAVTLQKEATIYISGFNAETKTVDGTTLGTILSKLKNDETSVAVVKDLIQAFDAFVGAVDSAGTVNVEIELR
jgi:uncharacterized repeat protein (TIGR02543 family)